VIPIDAALLSMAARHRLVVTVEDGSRVGGVGSRLAQELRDAGIAVPVVDLGIPRRFLDHGDRSAILADLGLTGQDVARRAVEAMARLEHEHDHERISVEPLDSHTETRPER
jgi:1-deoxy-D-xylulose-5-phosphate synthase